VEFATLIPIQLNDGTPLTEAQLGDIVTRLAFQFGGCTVVGNVSGHWIDSRDGKHYQDASIMIRVVCDRSRYEEARNVVIEIGRELNQKAMYFEVRYFDGIEFIDLE